MKVILFLSRYQQRTRRLTHAIANELRDTVSIKHVSNKLNISASTVTRILDTLNYELPTLKKAIAIDEFKVNANTGKYQYILVDSLKCKVLDIFPDSTQSHLTSYFRTIPKKERNHMTPTLRKYYKRSKTLIHKRYDSLKQEDKKACDIMLLYNDELRKAHYLKEWFYKICQETKYSFQREQFLKWLANAETCGMKDFEDVAATYRRFSKGILSAFKYGITNDPTEGFNNKIKVMKRTSYGIRNFERFRTRILHCTN
uniref:transposase n=1 Tax=Anaerosacchariphilus polymeriproducens TaxID=1812858 RepID=UPI00138FCC5A|nr:transposase [Anaerosacchariphilus polymeriproducens]